MGISSSEPGFIPKPPKKRAASLTINPKPQIKPRGHVGRLARIIESDPLEVLAMQMSEGCALEWMNE
jgi:hypothetical protein